ncbi:MAG: arsenate reductase family protein [Spirochaetaceae bacterium]
MVNSSSISWLSIDRVSGFLHHSRMVPQIVGTKKSKDTRRVMRYCSDRGIEYQFVDLNERTPGRREIEAFASAAGGFEQLIDASSDAFKKLNLAYMAYDPEEVITEYPGVLRVPIIRTDSGTGVQPSDAELSRLLGL